MISRLYTWALVTSVFLYPFLSLLAIIIFNYSGIRINEFFVALMLLLAFGDVLFQLFKLQTKITFVILNVFILSLQVAIAGQLMNSSRDVAYITTTIYPVVFMQAICVRSINVKYTVHLDPRQLWFLFCGSLIVLLFGFYEKFFISDDVLIGFNYYSALGAAKGLEYSGVPENLFSFVDGFEFRRMVSFFGEPLYLAYYLLPYFCVSYIFYRYKKSPFSLFLCLFFSLGIILTISRYIIIAAIFSVMLFELHYSKYSRVFAVVCGLFILSTSPILLILAEKMYEIDASFKGHIDSTLSAVERIGFSGIFYPSESKVINNYFAMTSGTGFVTESGILLSTSVIGGIGCLAVYCLWVVSALQNAKSFGKIVSKKSCKDNIPFDTDLSMAVPYISIAYLLTTFLSPHLFTFQQSAFALSIMAILQRCNFKSDGSEG
jgi:hypothetical protein